MIASDIVMKRHFPRSFGPRPSLILALSCGLALGWVLAALMLATDPSGVFSERGPVERLSAFYLVVAGLWLLLDQLRRRSLADWHLVALVLAAATRELDWDKAFTATGVMSLKLYTRDHPLADKLIGALILTFLAWALLRLLRRDLGGWLRGLGRHDPGSLLVALALALYGCAKTLDGLGRKLAPWGIELSATAGMLAGRGEEVLELFAAIIILQAVALHVAPAGAGAPAGAAPRPLSADDRDARSSAGTPR